jgi:hypothetical protein
MFGEIPEEYRAEVERVMARAEFISKKYDGKGIPYKQIEIGKVYKIIDRSGYDYENPVLTNGRVTGKYVLPGSESEPEPELRILYRDIVTGTLGSTSYNETIFLPTVDDIHKRVTTTTGILPERLHENVISKISSFVSGGGRRRRTNKSRSRRSKTNKSRKHRKHR